MQNDDSQTAKNKKTAPTAKRYFVLCLLTFAELAVMYIIQNVYGCENTKTAFFGLCTLALSLVAFFAAVNVCMRKLNKDKK